VELKWGVILAERDIDGWIILVTMESDEIQGIACVEREFMELDSSVEGEILFFMRFQLS